MELLDVRAVILSSPNVSTTLFELRCRDFGRGVLMFKAVGGE